MDDLANRIYSGDGEIHYEPLPGAWRQQERYVASKDLAEAVNIALYLRRPLLLEGDPGSGKSRLPYSVAYELGYPLEAIHVRSTSRAQELLYTFDALQRLYDMQEGRKGRSSTAKFSKVDYVRLGKLGEAIKLAQADTPSVVLIDEIDKADIDFPNDLLEVLDRMQFEVAEASDSEGWKFDAFKGTEREERRAFLPLVIITSNREKELPAPFLRRCLYFYIDFPDDQLLNEIIASHFPTGVTPLFEQALDKFWQLRQQQQFRWRKVPGTSELLDWLRLLEKAEQEKSLTVLGLEETPFSKLPYLQALVKTQSDLDSLAGV